MKKIFLLLFLIAARGFAGAQGFGTHFEDSAYRTFLFIDTVHYHHNNWQVGRPHKLVFDSAVSYPNALVTDTSHPYSPHDTSVFIVKAVKHTNPPHAQPFLYGLSFNYQLDIDSNATASIEFSGDGGLSWKNILKDTLGSYEWTWEGKPNFDTSTHGWKFFHVSYGFLDGSADTTLFRFTFMSGSNDSAKDGWIIDDLSIWYYVEGLVPTVGNNSSVSIFPNPGSTVLTISCPERIASVAITNLIGQTLYSHKYNASQVQIDVSTFPAGIYLIRINGTEVRKFVKQ
jgi:hypothetical protein